MAFAESKCPQVVKSVSDVSLSRRTVVRQVEGISSDIEYQIKVTVNDLEYYPLALDESNRYQRNSSTSCLHSSCRQRF